MSLCAISILANTARAETTCNDVIRSCDAAISAKNIEIHKLGVALRESRDQSGTLTTELNEANAKLESPFRNPFIVIPMAVVIGAAGGMYLMRK